VKHIVAYVASHPGGLPVVRERPVPPLGQEDLLVEVEAAVLGAPELRALDRGGDVVPGSAAVGRVVMTGPAAEDALGQRVLVGPLEACGECVACRRGRLCACASRVRRGLDADGTLASHVVARRRWVCTLDGPLLGKVDAAWAAALPREAALAVTMVARAGVAPGDLTVWLGGETIAELGSQVARAKGALAIAPHTVELPDSELFAALEARSTAPATWRLFETGGHDATRQRACRLAASGATLTLLAGDAAGTDHDAPLPLCAALGRDVEVRGVAAPHPDLVPETVALACRGELDLAPWVTVLPISELARAVTDLRCGRRGDKLTILSFQAKGRVD
jgi:D-arabinose 1-dehydrogenase-like Zn-dependent alcohol dehydrogenase